MPVAVSDVARGLVVGVEPGEMVVFHDVALQLDDVRVGVRRAVELEDRLELDAGCGKHYGGQKGHRSGDCGEEAHCEVSMREDC